VIPLAAFPKLYLLHKLYLYRSFHLRMRSIFLEFGDCKEFHRQLNFRLYDADIYLLLYKNHGILSFSTGRALIMGMNPVEKNAKLLFNGQPLDLRLLIPCILLANPVK